MERFTAFFLVGLLLTLLLQSTNGQYYSEEIVEERCEVCDFTAGLGGAAPVFPQSSPLLLPASLSSFGLTQASGSPLSFSIEFWAYANRITSSDGQVLVSRSSPSHTSVRYADFILRLNANGNLNFVMGSGADTITEYGININCGDLVPEETWTHISMNVITPPGERDPTSIAIYVNATRACTWSGGFVGKRNILIDEHIQFGQFKDGKGNLQQFNGQLDEIRVWKRARPQRLVLSTYRFALNGDETGLTAYYKFDNSNATNVAVDSSADALYAGMFTSEVVYKGSAVPLRNVHAPDPGVPIQFTLAGYAFDDEQYVAVIPGPGLFDGDLFFDANASRPYEYNDPIPAFSGAEFPVIYYLSENTTVGFKDFTTYFYASRRDDNNEVSHYLNGAIPQLGVIEIDAAALGCDGSGGQTDDCGECEGYNFNECRGCDGIINSTLEYDDCGVCGGNNTDGCMGCDREPMSGLTFDECGVCGGDGTTCLCSIIEYQGRNRSQLDAAIAYVRADDVRERVDVTLVKLATSAENVRNSSFVLTSSVLNETLALLSEYQDEAKYFDDTVAYFNATLQTFGYGSCTDCNGSTTGRCSGCPPSGAFSRRSEDNL